jgi:hypothetical protein
LTSCAANLRYGWGASADIYCTGKLENGVYKGLYKSTDAGRTWSFLRVDGRTDYVVNSYAAGPGDSLAVAWSDGPNPGKVSFIFDDSIYEEQWQTIQDVGVDRTYGLMLEGFDSTGRLLALGSHSQPGDPEPLAGPGLLAFSSGYRLSSDESANLRYQWQRLDEPVAAGIASRTWALGPTPLGEQQENAVPSASPVVVQYFDKGRIISTDRRAQASQQPQHSPQPQPPQPQPPQSPQQGADQAVKIDEGGDLVLQMVTGRLRVGPSEWDERSSCAIPVVGGSYIGQGQNGPAPTYATFHNVAFTGGIDNRVPDRTGQVIATGLTNHGITSTVPISSPVRLAAYDSVGGHNIAQPFWDFLHSDGPVIDNGQVENALLFPDWVSTMGHPITEPYWTQFSLDATSDAQWALVQLFERRVLTYTPANPRDWQVEMGNAGLHYYLWRYGGYTPGQ